MTTPVGSILARKYSRKLTPSEQRDIHRVFRGSVKTNWVRIYAGNLGSMGVTNAGWGIDEIYLGRHWKKPPMWLLVHEMVHVWQAQAMMFGGLRYKANALAHHAYHGIRGTPGRVYKFPASDLGTKPWNHFSIEEQAQLVQQWFQNGMRQSAPEFRYIKWCIRKKRYIGAAGYVVPPP